MTTNCRTCQAPVRWVVTWAGSRMPLDPEPDPQRGNVMLAPVDPEPEVRARVLSGTALEGARCMGVELFTSHFATCPDANQHRRRS